MNKKIKIFIYILLILIILGVVFWRLDFKRSEGMRLGVNFSQPQAIFLNLDWKKVYISILDDLKFRRLRLQAYWPEIEKEPGKFDFTDLDWQVKEAKKRDAKIIMTIGRRQPHWPECHSPAWADSLSEKEAQEKILSMLTQVVKHYKKESNIIMWQVDNEPLVSWFGKCPPPNKEFLKQEIALVKKLDFRPVLITDSGELSLWYKASKFGDYFGTTMYSAVWSKYFGYVDYKYFFPPAYYNFKARLVGLLPQSVIISELQAEPWQRIDLSDMTLEEQRRTLSADRLKENVLFAESSGFTEAYLWGAEYWYWLKETQQDDSVWQMAKSLLR